MLLAYGLWDAAGSALKGVLVIGAILQVVPILVYLERKISAYIQGRLGPNRVGPWGLLQPVADAVKLAFKEEIIPNGADKVLYLIAPFLAFLPSAAAFAFVPFGPVLVGEDGGVLSDLRIAPGTGAGLLMLLATTTLAVYGIAFGGWASNSKYPLMGAVRATAQMISYEIAMGLALVAVIATTGSIDLQQAVADQARPLFGPNLGLVSWIPNWHVFHQPVAFLLFVVAMFAENNRLPFDMAEAEPELGAGFHTEYTGLKFAMFFMGEYVAMITMSGVCVTLFLGGWHFPGLFALNGLSSVTGWPLAALGVVVFTTKVMLVLCFYMWVRWSLPRFRYDQLMRLGWKMMIPVGLANLFVTGALIAL